MKRGDIYYVNSNYQEVGSETRGGRPAVIVSNEKNNETSDTVEIVYMTTKTKTDLPTHVVTRRAPKISTVLCEQITTVDKKRLGDWIGAVSDNELAEIDSALAISLGIDFATLPGKRTEEPAKEPEAPQAEPASNKELDDMKDRAIKAETERDVYMGLYRELLEKCTGVSV